MADLNAGLEFGFLSSLVNISFPQGRFLIAEASTTNTGTTSYNQDGEPFTVLMPGSLAQSGVTLIPATLKQFNAGPPPIVNPISLIMRQQFYDWEQPIPAFISADHTVGRAVAFFNLQTIGPKIGSPPTISIRFSMAAHGTSAPVPPPVPGIAYYIYNTLNGSIVSGGGTAGQSWFDNNLQTAINDNVFPPSLQPAVTDPVLDASFAGGFPSGPHFGSDLTYDWFDIGFTGYINPFPTAAAAAAAIAALAAGGATNYAMFAWAQSVQPPTPYGAQCNWTLKFSSWLHQLNFVVNPDGTTAFDYGEAVTVQTVNSGGNNPPARTVTVNLNPATLDFLAA